MSENGRGGKYVYCIIGRARRESFGPIGIGERGDEVHTISFRDLAAVVSDSPLARYRVSRENALTHQRVIEKVMEDHALLPVRFGTVAGSEAQVPRILKARYDEFQFHLRRVADKSEFGVKAIWKAEAAFGEVVAENPEIQRLRASLEGMPAEKTHYQRIDLGRMVERALEAKRQSEGERIVSLLKRHSVDWRINRNLHERMVVNAAFLVDKTQQEAFDEEMGRLDACHGSRMEFRYVGPVPPFNFVEIFIDFDELAVSRAS